MISIDKQTNDLKISRGDTFTIRVNLTGGVTLGENDLVRFAVKKTIGSSEVLFSKDVRNPGEQWADIDALKSELEAVKSSLAAVQTAISDAQNFTIIYPNGGTAEKPASITANKRYVEANPFPGYYVYCIPQLKYNHEWGKPGEFIFSNSGWGTAANQLLPSDKIIIQTGSSSVFSGSNNQGGAPYTNGPSSPISSAPCRVLVYKLGKI